jgi:protein TonB
MSATLDRPIITSGDRLGMTLVLAVLVHTIVILGVGFAPEPVKMPRFDAMEVILVPLTSEAPDEASQLAQAALEGGGTASGAGDRPVAPIVNPQAALSTELAMPPPPALDPVPVEQAVAREAATRPEPQVDTMTVAPAANAAPDRLAAPAADAQAQASATAVQQPEPSTSAGTDNVDTRLSRPTPSAAELITSSFAIASLSAEIQQRLDARSQRPRRRFVSASTREYRYAAYMEAWRSKVERVGNLNYPDEARRRNLSGSLILEVIIEPNGKVHEMIVRRPSGHAVLDDAAQRIVALAGPFAPFPPDIARDTDYLHITRTWQFLDSAQFLSK